MFEFVLNGKIELEIPDDFVKDFKELLQKYKTNFHGQTAIYKLPEYVDFQKVEESGDSDVQQSSSVL